MSEVTVDASTSTGPGLRYLVDFGDGATATNAVARHVYGAAGTYTVTLTITDGTGRVNATARRELVVASPVGAWLYSGFLARAGQVEVRTLTLTAQDGVSVRGTLTRVGGRDSTVTGTLTPDRQIRVAVDGGSETLEGRLPSVLTGDGVTWPAAARGGVADGETLIFRRRSGEPSGPPPHAVFAMRFFSFSAPFAVKQISPVRFDAAASQGDGLTYYIEFGDRQFTTDATAVHPLEKVGAYTARLTVVDRFGRTDVESRPFEVKTLAECGYYIWWEGPGHHLCFTSQEGTQVTGDLSRNGDPLASGQFRGTVNPNGEVRLTLEGAAVALVGTLTLGTISYESNRLVLTYVGGPHNGETFTLYFRQGY